MSLANRLLVWSRHRYAKDLGSRGYPLREAVKRHFRLSCVAQSFLQRASVGASKSERFEFSKGKATIGQRCRKIAREVMRSMLELSKRLFMEGKSTDDVMEMLMPA